MPREKKEGSSLFKLALLPLVFAVLYPMWRTIQANDPITFFLPNLLLFTPFRETTRSLWNSLVQIDTTKPIEPQEVPTIDAKDFTMEKFRILTENWRYPAIVRGMFKGTAAMEKWPTKEYFTSRLGSFQVPVVHNAIVGKVQNNRSVMAFGDAFADIMDDPQSKTYLFFPVQSRFNFNGSDAGSLKKLQSEVNDIVLNDLELNRIWPGFGTSIHSTYFGSQLIIGRGSNDSDATTGTGWHCAGGNNWFAQVVGTKRWFFLDPKYSAYMYPLRGGKVNMMTGNKNMGELQKYLPLRYGDVRAGDLLYNPDWEWHTIKNYEGLSIGVPIREVNFTLSMQNNLQYSTIILINKALEKLNLDIGGYPPAN